MSSTILHVRGSIHGNGYKLVRPLVDGSSVLFEALHPNLAEACVVRLFPEIAAGSQDARRVEKGARLGSSLGFFGVARVVDFNFGDGPAFIALERIGGRSLGRVLAEDGLLPVSSTVKLVEQMAETLWAAHAIGAVHGDLHPGAVRLTSDQFGGVRTTILGFGWSQVARKVGGDPRHALYRAPEQRRGSAPEVTAPSVDQFALGAIAYEMLAGCSYTSEESSDLADPDANRSRQPPRIADMVMGLPAQVDEVLRRALSYDPLQRFPDVRQFALALRRAAEPHDQPASAPEPVAKLQPPRPELRAVPPPEPWARDFGDALTPTSIKQPNLSARTRALFAAAGVLTVVVAVGVMASSMRRPAARTGGPPAPETAPATEPSPAAEAAPVGAPARSGTEVDGPPKAAATPPILSSAVPSPGAFKLRNHRRTRPHLRSHRRAGSTSAGHRPLVR